jgi:PTH1 family peptidyl-tRNA hydrolase
LPQRWLVVGLGNPGPEYEFSPHNAGFLAVDRFAAQNGIRVSRKEAMAHVGIGSFGGIEVIVAKPQTYMNESGGSVKQLLPKYELDASALLLVYDELALPWGQLRVRPKGSAAGHNGVSSVIRSTGTEDFPRLRIGVHPGHPLSSGKDYLLSPVRRGQLKEWDSILMRAAEAIESIIADGVEKSMAKFNRKIEDPTPEDE